MPHALIVGAGIAGDALAVLLERDGWRVTVVELAPTLRGGGQTVDLRGDCREVLARMDLLDATRARLLPQRGAAWVNAAGRRLASMPVTAFGGRGFISSEELLRSDLACLLHAACGPRVNHRFADTVEALEDTATGIRAHLRSGERLDADLVVGADGTHSRVRALRFGPEEHCRKPLGLAHAWFTLDKHAGTPSLDGWALMYNAPADAS
ncbi:MAG TPA: FAD-dependent monooxygenase [Rhodanobacteraceae bacterium]